MPYGLWFDDSLHSTNTHPISPIPSPHSPPTNVWSQLDVPLSAFNFITFSILQKAAPLTSIRPDLISCSSFNTPSPHTLFKHDPLYHSMAWTGQFESYVRRLMTILSFECIALLCTAIQSRWAIPFSSQRDDYSPSAFLRQWASFHCQFDKQLVERTGEWQSPDVVAFVCFVLTSGAN